MTRKALLYIITICIIFSSLFSFTDVTDAAALNHGILADAGVNAGAFDEYAEVKIIDKDGTVHIYEVSGKVRIDGERFEYVEDIEYALDTEEFIEYTLSNGKITSINYDSHGTVYRDVLYDAEDRCFLIDGIDTSSLLVYGNYDGEKYELPYLDGEHKYNVSVTDKCISVLGYSSKEKPHTIKNTEIFDSFNFDEERYISASCSPGTGNVRFCGTLCDKDGNVLDTESSWISRDDWKSDDYAELEFAEVLPNENGTYTVKLHLEDIEGNIVSPVYSYEYKIDKRYIGYGYIDAFGESASGFEDVIQIRFADTSNEYVIYDLAKRVKVNGTSYDDYEIYDDVSNDMYDCYARFIENNGRITHIDYDPDNECENYEATYDKETGTLVADGVNLDGLPVYCTRLTYFGDDHTYDIDVYKYAICVNWYSAGDYDITLGNIELEAGTKEIKDSRDVQVSCEISNSINYKGSFLCGELYDAKGDKITQSKAEIEAYEEEEGFYYEESFLVFDDAVANENAEYTAVFWVEDENATQISPAYEYDLNVEKMGIYSGQIVDVGYSAYAFDYFCDIKVRFENGTERTFSLADRVRINGPSVRTEYLEEDGITAAMKGAFASFNVVDGTVRTLNFDENTTPIVSTAVYDEENKALVSSDDNIDLDISSLPVFYKTANGTVGRYRKPYLAENHIYEIEIYNNAVNITDYTADNKSYTVKDIALSALKNDDLSTSMRISMNAEFLSLMAEDDEEVVVRVTNSDGSFDETKRMSLSDVSGGYIAYELPEKADIYTANMWIERNGEVVSNVYKSSMTVTDNQVMSGVVDAFHRSSQNSATVYINGDKYFVAYDETTVNGETVTYDNFREIIELGMIVRYTVKDSIITAVYSDMENVDNLTAIYNAENNTLLLSDGNNEYGSAGTIDLSEFTVVDYDIPELDENHIYDIKMYGYAAEIVGSTAKDKEYAIDKVRCYENITPDFTHEMVLNVEYNDGYEYVDIEKDLTVIAELYDDKSSLVGRKEVSDADYECEIIFDNLPNKTCEYTAKIWLEDETGEISHKCSTVVMTDYVPVMTGEFAEYEDGEWYLIEEGEDCYTSLDMTSPDTVINGNPVDEYYDEAAGTFITPPAGTNVEYVYGYDEYAVYLRYSTDNVLNVYDYSYDAVDENTNSIIINNKVLNPDGEADTGNYYAALYRAGNLISVDMADISLDAYGNANIPATLENVASGDIIKLFAWNDTFRQFVPSQEYKVRKVYDDMELVRVK